MMSKYLCDTLGRYPTSEILYGVSDHKSIVLQLDFGKIYVYYPFNFNHYWLEDTKFCTMFFEKW